MANPFPADLQMGVFAPTGSDLYNKRVAYNQGRGVPGGGAGFVPGVDTAMAGGVNRFMQTQADLPWQMNLPNYQSMRSQQSQNILSQLQGDVPQDVINQILQQAAERGIATGAPKSQNANAAYLRALGLTSLGMQQQGSQLLDVAMQQTPQAELWNPMSLYVPERLAAQQLNAAKEGAGESTSSKGWFERFPVYKTEYIWPKGGSF